MRGRHRFVNMAIDEQPLRPKCVPGNQNRDRNNRNRKSCRRFSCPCLRDLRHLLFVPFTMTGTKRSTMDSSRREELLDENSRVVRVLFGEEVTTLHRLSLRTRSPLAPNAHRPSIF